MAAMAVGWSASQIEKELVQTLARVLVWEEAGRVQGHAIGRSVAGEVHVHEIAVSPQARRQGGGRALLEALLQACGTGPALLELRASNTPALALYQVCGFIIVGRRTRYYPDGEDALLMTRPG